MSLKKIIDLDLLGRFLDKVKALIPTKTSELENDAGFMAGMTILSYGSSTWADFIAAYGDNKVVYCRASSNSNPASGSQTRLAFMAYVNNATTPTEVEFQYYRSVNAHTDSQQGDQVYVYKLNKNSGWSVTVRNTFSKVATGTGLTHTYSNGTITLANSEIVPGVVSTAADGLAPQLPNESTTTKFLRQDATWAVPPDTTYESKAAASGGTAVSLVTTGEKYTWNNKGTYSKPSGGIPDSDIASAATWNAKGNGTIAGITMNGASKGTSGVVDLGTVITSHQDISGKADKSATVSNVAYDSTNKKITKTINGTTSDVVTATTLKTAMALNNVENKSSATIRGELTKANVTTALGYTPPTTDTTYESKAAASGGTDVSLVTTGEKYTWNSKQAALVSGTNIKTINGLSLLGSGNLAVSGLPAVTSSDNDKVLKVVSGAWAAANNDGGQFIVNVQYLNGQYKSNKTHKQIVDAIDAGYTVVVRYDSTYYNLEAYVSSSKYVSFSQTHYLDSELSVLVRYFTMSGGDDVDTFTRYSNGVQKFTYPQNPNPICSVYYDNEQEKYVFDYEGKTDFSEVFATTGSIEGAPILKWEEGFCDPLDEEQPDVYTKMFALTDAYTTNEDWTYTGHLVFSRIVDGTVPKIERFEISQDFDTYDTFASATVTYSEKPLGGSMPVNAAVIHVNAPLGSAITFFKDSTVMEAVTAAQTYPNADGKTEDYYYSVPTSDFGSWTVAASKSGENDVTQSFSILVAKQYDAFLSYLAPYDFQAVEWLQTSTNVYFDTGIVPTTTNYMTKVSLQVAVTNGGSIFNVEGGYGMGKVGSYEQLYYYYVGGQAKLNVPGIATVGTDFDIIYNNDSGVVMINGVEVSANPNIQAINNRQYSILVSAERYGSTVSYYGTWRYKRFTVLERDTKNVLIDMHPCYRKIDNMPGFWDSVSNTFMTQLGTGIITVGPDV